jgi:hemolysin activation/secretion protein
MSRSPGIGVALMLLAPLALAAGQEPLRIGRIELQLHDVYPELDGISPEFPYSVANLLHLRTREEVVRRELLFAEGDVYRPELLAETERNLRRFPFLRFVRVEASEPRDGLVDVTVHTIDAWTTKLQFNVGSSGGKATGSAGVVEDNLLGLGKSFSAFYVIDSERASTRLQYQDPRLLGRFLSLTLGYSTGEGLRRIQTQLVRPFHSTLTRWSWGALLDRSEVLEFLYEAGAESLRFEQDRWRADAYLARALGEDPELVRRVRLGWRIVEDRFAPESGAEALPESFLDADRRFSGPLLGFELRRQRFIRETNIYTFVRDEDINLGTQLIGEAAWFAQQLGSSRSAFWLGLAASRGVAFGRGHFALGSARLGGRLQDGRLRNGQARVRLDYFYRLTGRMTLAASSQLDVLRRPDPEAQIVLGGEEGLRGYKLRLFTGNKGLLSRLEARMLLVEDLLRVCSIGVVGFADAGNVWREGQTLRPLEENVDLGAGVRVAFPRSSRGNVLRFDVSYALQDNGFEGPWLISFGSAQSF